MILKPYRQRSKLNRLWRRFYFWFSGPDAQALGLFAASLALCAWWFGMVVR